MSNEGPVRVDRSVVEDHTSRTSGNVGAFRGAAGEVNRQQANLVSQTEGGAGSNNLRAMQQSANRHASDIEDSINKANAKTSQHADEFIKNVQNAANQMPTI